MHTRLLRLVHLSDSHLGRISAWSLSLQEQKHHGFQLIPGTTRRYFADLIIAYLQDVLALTLLTPARAAAAARLTPPMFPGNDGAGAAVCLKGEAFRQTVASMQVGWQTFKARS